MKAPWFALYAGDFLASPDVQLMGPHEVGAYFLLLLHSWQSDTPGYLSNDEDRLRRAARFTVKQWTESREIILGKWPIAENGMRRNPRLYLESTKQVERRERLAANGQKGGRPPKQKDLPDKPKNNLQLSEGNQKDILQEPSGLLSQPQPQSSNEDGAAIKKTGFENQPNPGRDAAIATGDPAEEQRWDESPLVKPKAFQAICDRLGRKGIAYEKYRKEALVSAEDANISRTITQWTSWIKKYLTNHEPLVMQSADMPTELTPRHLLPAPGEETPGQIITVRGDHDQQMNRMLIDSHQRNWPTAIINAIRS